MGSWKIWWPTSSLLRPTLLPMLFHFLTLFSLSSLLITASHATSAPFVFNVTTICAASFISASKTSRNVTDLTKRTKKSSTKNNDTHKYFVRTKFYTRKMYQCSTSICIKKVALQQNNWVHRTGRIALTACSHICDGRVQCLYFLFEVFRSKKPTGSKVKT